MVRVKRIKDNPRCVASITVRARRVNSSMQIDNQDRRVLGIFHRPGVANIDASDYGHPEDQ
jgi:hypothetical protein